MVRSVGVSGSMAIVLGCMVLAAAQGPPGGRPVPVAVARAADMDLATGQPFVGTVLPAHTATWAANSSGGSAPCARAASSS